MLSSPTILLYISSALSNSDFKRSVFARLKRFPITSSVIFGIVCSVPQYSQVAVVSFSFISSVPPHILHFNVDILIFPFIFAVAVRLFLLQRFYLSTSLRDQPAKLLCQLPRIIRTVLYTVGKRTEFYRNIAFDTAQ